MIDVHKYNELWGIWIFVFTLNHGQAAVERGFNINKDTQVENLRETSLVSLRLVYDEVLVRGDISNLDIPPALA